MKKNMLAMYELLRSFWGKRFRVKVKMLTYYKIFGKRIFQIRKFVGHFLNAI